MRDTSLKRWSITGILGTVVIASAVPVWLVLQETRLNSPHHQKEQIAEFVGSRVCRECHEKEYKRWQGSDHDDAMDIADDTTVLGDFDDAVHTEKGVTSRFYRKDGRFMVNTEGPNGEYSDFEIQYTFGVDPLQQYLIPFPGGRLQALNIAWDNDANRWYTLYPSQEIRADDWLHWTRNGQNWNGMCAECHSTNLQKNYDAKTDTYNTTWSEMDVGCEACHGPASNHLDWARTDPMARPKIENYGLTIDTSSLDSKGEVALCAPCHSRRSELGDYDHQQMAPLQYHLPTLLEQGIYYADGQILDEVYVWGSFTQSKMYQRGVQCSDCHDVHSLKHRAEGNGLCLQCHRADAYDTKAHHFHKKQHLGKPSQGALCIKCHMPETPYMVIDERADHSIRIPRPDLTQSIGTPNACSQQGCHANETLEWILSAFTKWYGEAQKPHYGTVLTTGRKGDPRSQKGLGKIANNILFPAVVRATALSLLGQFHNKKSETIFETLLMDEDALIRYAALRYMPDSSQTAHFVERAAPLLSDPIKGVRIQAAQRLADIPKKVLKPYQKKALEVSLEEYKKAMMHAYDLPSSGFNLGNLYTRLGQNTKAEAAYRKSIKVDPLFYPSKVNLAVLLSGRGKNQEARKLLEEVIEAYPNQYETHYSLGLLLGELNAYEKAAKHLAIAAEGMPNHAGAKKNLHAVQAYLRRVKNEH